MNQIAPLAADIASGPAFAELRAGNLGVRLATTSDELDAVQALRYNIFYAEMGAHADAETARSKRDRDQFDAIADHLLVIDHDVAGDARGVVGTYRLIRQEAAARFGRFYSADEYDIGILERFPG
ncbi:MAG TPA: GNAT family N-acetyltransferase, partial [Acetobacteraceae bacterium]|nr:GNAT family N-acetyltransferase [Acetobacteraceae bacterium]